MEREQEIDREMVEVEGHTSGPLQQREKASLRSSGACRQEGGRKRVLLSFL